MFLSIVVLALASVASVSAGGCRGHGCGHSIRPVHKPCKQHEVCEETPLIDCKQLEQKLVGYDGTDTGNKILFDVYWGNRVLDFETVTGNGTVSGSIPDALFGCTKKDTNTNSMGTPIGETYDQRHIDNAFPLDWRCDLSTPEPITTFDPQSGYLYELPTDAQFEAFVRDHGLELDTVIILYDRSPAYNRMATRAYFVFKYFGFQNVYIVDGGLDRCLADNERPGSDPLKTNIPTTTVYPANPADSSVSIVPGSVEITDAKFVAENLNNKFVKLIDARPRSMYWGYRYNDVNDPADDTDRPGGLIHTGQLIDRLGHIPGCYNRAWSNNYDWWQATVLGEGSPRTFVTFKPASELATIYSQFLDSQVTTVTICNEGIHAVLDAFVLKDILCFDNVLIYEGSHGEWAQLAVGGPLGSPAQAGRTAPLVTGCEIGPQECRTNEGEAPAAGSAASYP